MDIAIDKSTDAPAVSTGKAKKIMKWAGWVGISLWLLGFFTLVKLPEVRLKNLIQGHLANALADFGVTLHPGETSFSFFFGMKFKMKKVRLELPGSKEVLIDEIQASPSFSSLFLFRLGADLYIRKDKGDLSATVAMRGKKNIFVSFNADQLDLGKLDIMPALAKVKLKAVLDGKGSFSAETTPFGKMLPNTLTGNLALRINNLLIDEQTVVFGGGYGGEGGVPFPLPQIAISEGRIEFSADKGKIKIKTVKLGSKVGDDLVTSVTGDLTVTADPANSVLNLQIPQLKTSEAVRKRLTLDFLLSRFKQPDNSFTGITLSGPASGLHVPL